MKCSIRTISRTVINIEAEAVAVINVDGALTVKPGHSKFGTILKQGMIVVQTTDAKYEYYVSAGRFSPTLSCDATFYGNLFPPLNKERFATQWTHLYEACYGRNAKEIEDNNSKLSTRTTGSFAHELRALPLYGGFASVDKNRVNITTQFVYDLHQSELTSAAIRDKIQKITDYAIDRIKMACDYPYPPCIDPNINKHAAWFEHDSAWEECLTLLELYYVLMLRAGVALTDAREELWSESNNVIKRWYDTCTSAVPLDVI